ncbi:hypothetical protein ABFS82_04G217400 [Erythranthe guttata]|uniref:RING-type E3 ubiquitin transferase n=1 Tax=Erythranthe guttata TaxID=4155 RepID=A0A022Q3M1_ERYGU|nr:PREDICTED: U-box domain-containing protein 9-like [Erythranthe guttata]EYU21095.1 hypothetical protein MIMGU_mgv1a005997mg [Erythranthe guttata]|eukprot:XP_012856953.1 PREDICTED: U-box domain-containing protein 9-like [Erythranthe guttata]
MAKSGVIEGDPAAAAVKAAELKKELLKLVKAIVDEEDVNLDAVERAYQMLVALKEMKLKKTVSLKLRTDRELASAGTVPEEFKCPLSMELMRDPVIIDSGQTYDRPFIQKWLKSGNRTCPKTQQVLTHTTLAPNHLIREMITKWCNKHGIKLPDPINYTYEEGFAESDREHFLSLLNRMSSALSEQKEAAKELRRLTRKTASVRALFAETPNAIPQLLAPLSNGTIGAHPDLHEDIITSVLNIAIHDDNNKKLVAETPAAIPLLIDAVKNGSIETRSNAAATIFTLSALDSNKALLGKSGALKPLIELLREGHPAAMNDAASAIFNLCILHENKVRAVRDGAVVVILEKIKNRARVDILLPPLALLSTNQKCVEEMGDLEAVPCLFEIIRETTCDRNKENCIAMLHAICFSDRSKWKAMREEESMHRTISQVAHNGTSRAQRKARGILERLNKSVNVTHTA